jgi:predicted RNA-binding protein associated with RNAse of E/G family
VKWPNRRLGIARAMLLGEDQFGRWLGVVAGSPWRMADGSDSGIFLTSFVKLIPEDTYWSVCFNHVEPMVDVDIVLPVQWHDEIIEEIDLELDVLQDADGSVWVKDQDEFDRVRAIYDMPEAIVEQAQTTCEQIRARVEAGDEPFRSVGFAWLAGFLAEYDPTVEFGSRKDR